MLNQKQIQQYFVDLNDELGRLGVQGEVGLCGGAVMCLVFQARESTKDVDGIFAPTKEIRLAAKRVAKKNNLPEDWLNDAAKGFFLQDPPKQTVMELSHLRVWAPKADYMLAMKSISARFDSHDKTDVQFLIAQLELKSVEEVFAIIQKYYPKEKIPAKTQFLLEELFEVGDK